MQNKKQRYYLLPVKDLVVFPKSITSVLVGRKKSINIVENAFKDGDLIFVVAQKNTAQDEVRVDNLFQFGTISKIVQKTDINNGQKRIIIEGVARAKILNYFEDDDTYSVEVEEIPENKITPAKQKKIDELKSILFSKMREILQASDKYNEDIFVTLDFFKTINEIIFYSTAFMNLSLERRQELLEARFTGVASGSTGSTGSCSVGAKVSKIVIFI